MHADVISDPDAPWACTMYHMDTKLSMDKIRLRHSLCTMKLGREEIRRFVDRHVLDWACCTSRFDEKTRSTNNSPILACWCRQNRIAIRSEKRNLFSLANGDHFRVVSRPTYTRHSLDATHEKLDIADSLEYVLRCFGSV
jgi:hypothetical protein